MIPQNRIRIYLPTAYIGRGFIHSPPKIVVSILKYAMTTSFNVPPIRHSVIHSFDIMQLTKGRYTV